MGNRDPSASSLKVADFLSPAPSAPGRGPPGVRAPRSGCCCSSRFLRSARESSEGSTSEAILRTIALQGAPEPWEPLLKYKETKIMLIFKVLIELYAIIPLTFREMFKCSHSNRYLQIQFVTYFARNVGYKFLNICRKDIKKFIKNSSVHHFWVLNQRSLSS